MSSTTPLPVGVGYGVVVGIGFFFAFVMCGISYIQVCTTPARHILETPTHKSVESIYSILYEDERRIQYRK